MYKSSNLKNNASSCPTHGAPKSEQIPYQPPVYSPGGGIGLTIDRCISMRQNNLVLFEVSVLSKYPGCSYKYLELINKLCSKPGGFIYCNMHDFIAKHNKNGFT